MVKALDAAHATGTRQTVKAISTVLIVIVPSLACMRRHHLSRLECTLNIIGTITGNPAIGPAD
jgi:hypothetical protein